MAKKTNLPDMGADIRAFSALNLNPINPIEKKNLSQETVSEAPKNQIEEAKPSVTVTQPIQDINDKNSHKTKIEAVLKKYGKKHPDKRVFSASITPRHHKLLNFIADALDIYTSDFLCTLVEEFYDKNKDVLIEENRLKNEEIL